MSQAGDGSPSREAMPSSSPSTPDPWLRQTGYPTHLQPPDDIPGLWPQRMDTVSEGMCGRKSQQ